MNKALQGPEGRKFYGSVTVGQRGQKLLVLGDLAQGIAITTIPSSRKT